MTDQLDRLLDQALSEYRDAEPLAGIEDRILRRIAVQPTKSSPWMRWMFGCPIPASFAGVGVFLVIATVLVAALWLGFRQQPHRQTVATNTAHPSEQQIASNATKVETPVTGATPPQSVSRPHPAAQPEVRQRSPLHDCHPERSEFAAGETNEVEGPLSQEQPGCSAPFKPASGLSGSANTRPNQFPAPAPLTREEHALIALARTHPDALPNQPENADQLNIAPIDIQPLAPESGATQGEPQ
jgi:hypothetical protein